MKMLASYLIVLLLLPASSWAITQGTLEQEAEPDQAAILQIIDLSGLTGLSIQARNLTQQALNEVSISTAKQYEIVDTVSESWSPAVLNQELAKVLSTFDEAQLAELNKVLLDNKVRQARAKEQQAIKEQGSANYQQYIQRLRAQPLTTERLGAIRKLDKAMQFSGLLIQARRSVYAGLQKTIKDWQPEANWQQKLNNRVVEFLLYVHRSTSNEEILRLADLYNGPEVQVLLQQFNQTLAAK